MDTIYQKLLNFLTPFSYTIMMAAKGYFLIDLSNSYKSNIYPIECGILIKFKDNNIMMIVLKGKIDC